MSKHCGTPGPLRRQPGLRPGRYRRRGHRHRWRRAAPTGSGADQQGHRYRDRRARDLAELPLDAVWPIICVDALWVKVRLGVKDVLVCDGLKGLPDVVTPTWPKATVQTCVIHLTRAALRLSSVRDHPSWCRP
ncbi:transposase [Streptomyces goshikiensis]|uniref:transposase n=1 Tax=Streptomyces goshikiensis TaxID=1942 RepID=UPI003650083E